MGLLVVLLLAVALFVVVLLPWRLLAMRRLARESAAGPAGPKPDEPRAVESPAIVRQVWENAGGPNASTRGPRIGMVLSVEPERGDAFVVEVEQTMARAQARRIRPGHVVTVRYRPADPSRAVVVGLE